MTDFVLDVSVAMAWCFADEATPQAQAILERLDSASAAVPSLWHLEVANVLTLAERKKRITAARVAEFVALLDELPIHVDTETHKHALGGVLSLARTQRLTAYDAAYLELAQRLGVPLATKDVVLRAAAKKIGVALLAA